MNNVYEGLFGRKFNFNDPVEVTCTMLPKEQTIGRLVQVRKKCGQFGSDVYFIRFPNGKLMTFENVGLESYTEKPLPPNDLDTIDCEYTIAEKFPEVGFVVEKPLQPASPSPAFGITVTHGLP